MNYDLIAEMHVNELKNYLKIHRLKISGNKNELLACIFSFMEKHVMPVKTIVEVKKDLKKEYGKKLTVDDRVILEPFKIPRKWLKEDESISANAVISRHNLMFYPTQLDSTDLSDDKNSKVYSYYESDWLKSLYFHKYLEVNAAFSKENVDKLKK